MTINYALGIWVYPGTLWEGLCPSSSTIFIQDGGVLVPRFGLSGGLNL